MDRKQLTLPHGGLVRHDLEDVHRVCYLDTDMLVLGDVCALAATDLQGTPVAARDSNVSEASEWRRAATRAFTSAIPHPKNRRIYISSMRTTKTR